MPKRLQKNGTTNLVVTVTELTTISSPEYVFEFEHEQSHQTVACILSDISTSSTRYNEFQVQDTVDVTFPYTGNYEYRIYEQAAGTGTTTTTGLNMVEKGRVYVYAADETKNEYSNDSLTDKVYEQ